MESVKRKSPRKSKPPESNRVDLIITAALETRASELILYDLQNRSPVTDYVIICSGRSQAHVRGISDNIEEFLKQSGIRHGSVEGYQEGSWVLLDYGEVIVHVFHPETRIYYDLEDLLKSFPRKDFPLEEEGEPLL